MNIVEARIIIKDFENYIKRTEEARDNNTLGYFSLLPHPLSEILKAHDVEIDYFKSIIKISDNKTVINKTKINLINIENKKEVLINIFNIIKKAPF